jgi:hypothetical protein
MGEGTGARGELKVVDKLATITCPHRRNKISGLRSGRRPASSKAWRIGVAMLCARRLSQQLPGLAT